jgi:predicted permease
MGFESVVQDVRYAVRGIRRAPWYAATVAATLGLALGLVASAFTVLNAYVFTPRDLPDPYALYSVSWDSETARRQRFRLSDYESLRQDTPHFSQLAASQNAAAMRDTTVINGMLVTGNYFELLGARPALGRLLTPQDAAAPGTGAVIVLSYNRWRSTFGGDPAIVGQRISLGGQRYEVVGVTEPNSKIPGEEVSSFFAPLTMAAAFGGSDPWSDPEAASLVVIGRLKSNAGAAPVRAWLDVWFHQRFPPRSDKAPVAVRLDSLATRIPLEGPAWGLFVVIMSAFGLVLLVACANVTNLMLARALARQSEVAVRLALGASRWRVARQLIVESLVLAVPAAAAGLALAMAAARAFPALILSTFPIASLPIDNILVPLDTDMRVLSFLGGVAVCAAVLITLAPAGRLTRLRLTQASRGEASPDTRGARLRSGLIAMQIGACALFLVGTVGLIDEATRLANPRSNLDYQPVSELQIDPAIRAAVAMRLGSEPAVERLAVTADIPLAGLSLRTVDVRTSTNITRRVGYTAVSSEYFPLFDIPVVRGRTFTLAETESRAAVAVVSAATAAALWPGADPVGQTVRVAPPRNSAAGVHLPEGNVRVIGVVEDVANGSIMEGVDPSCIYFTAAVDARPGMTLLVRGRNPEDVKAAAGLAVGAVAPNATFRLTPMSDIVRGVSWVFQAFSVTAGLLGIVGLMLAYSGTHAVVSFLVVQRTREFGVRMALGASAWRIMRGMMGEMSRTAAMGLVPGLAIIAALARLFAGSSPLVPEFGLRPYLAGAAIVVLAVIVATLLPLRGAARIDPARALRAD